MEPESFLVNRKNNEAKPPALQCRKAGFLPYWHIWPMIVK